MANAIIPDVQKSEQFAREMHPIVKRMQFNGFVPKSKIWVIVKIARMMEICDKMRLALRVEPEYTNILKFLSKHRWAGNYTFWYWVNKIYTLKRYFKWYYKMGGHTLWIRPHPKMGEILLDYQLLDIWEPETTKIVKGAVKPGMNCIDIGASIGYFTLLFSRQVGPTGHVIAVEPTDFQLPYLKKNVKLNHYQDRVEIHNVGAWDKTETVMMPRNAPPYVQTAAPCMAVDDIVAGRRIDFIKLDVDGAEPKVLRGLEKTFAANPQLVMVAEFYPKYIQDAGLSVDEYKEVINKYFSFTVIPGDYSNGCWNLLCVRGDGNNNPWPV